MLVVIPVCEKDEHLVLLNLRLCRRMEPGTDHEALITCDAQFRADRVINACRGWFKSVSIGRYPRCPWQGRWPAAPNWAWQQSARLVQQTRRDPWLWWEADAVPLRAGWISEIEAAYAAGGKHFGGCIVRGGAIPQPYMAGVAVYPAQISSFAPGALCNVHMPFDLALSLLDGVLSRTADLGKVIHHAYEPHGGGWQKGMPIPAAALYHRCKTGALQEKLLGKDNVPFVWKLYDGPVEGLREVPVSILLPIGPTPPEHVRECLESILAQTHTNWQLVAVIGPGVDAAQVRKLIPPSQLVLVKQKGKGLSNALNEGLAKCSHELVARMDADDRMVPDRLERQLRILVANTAVDVLGGAIQMFGDESTEVAHPQTVTMREMCETKWSLNHPTVLFRKSSVLAVGGYNPAITATEDFDLWYRMLSAGFRLHNTSDVLVHYRRHKGQKSTTDGALMSSGLSVPRLLERPRIRVCYIGSIIGDGGAEHWLADVIRATSSICDWTVGAEQKIYPAFEQEVRGIAQVAIGPEEVARHSRAADVVIIWWLAQKLVEYYHHGGELWGAIHTQLGDPFLAQHRAFDYTTFDKVISVSAETSKALCALGCPPERIVLINPALKPHYSIPAVPRRAWRAMHGVPEDAFVAGFLARLTLEKGAHHMLDASRVKAMKDVHFVMAGKLECVEASKVREEYGPRITLLDRIDDVPEFLGACDCLVVPSQWESFCYSIVEGWLAGIPVVSTPIGIAKAHPDWIIPISYSAKGVVAGVQKVLRGECPALGPIQKAAQTEFGWWRFRNDLLSLFSNVKRRTV